MTRFAWLATPLVVSLWLAPGLALAQPPATLTLGDAVSRAVDRYPAVLAATEQRAAAEAAVALSRSAFLPRADLMWQTNRATHNNAGGYMFPQQVIGAMIGPIVPASADSTLSYAGGALVTWVPFDFGARGATVQASEARRRAANAAVALTRTDVAVAAAQAYLAVLAAEEARRAAQAGVDRATAVFTVVDARARAGLRPGADAARARAEMAVAETAVARADQAVQVSRANLQQWIGELADSTALAAPASGAPTPPGAPDPVESAPAAQFQAARVAAAEATATAVARAYAPTIRLEGTAFTRATGVGPDGTAGTSLQHAYNWGAGVSVSFPLFDWPAQAARRAAERARAREQAARYDQTLVELRAARTRARAALDASVRIAQLAQPQLDAARAAEEQARARYAGGLGTIAEVADAGRLLTDADVNSAVSTIAVLQSAVAAASVGGTVDDVIDTIRAIEGR